MWEWGQVEKCNEDIFQKTTNTHGVVNSLVAVLVICSSSVRSDESKDFFISFKECLYVVVSYWMN